MNESNEDYRDVEDGGRLYLDEPNQPQSFDIKLEGISECTDENPCSDCKKYGDKQEPETIGQWLDRVCADAYLHDCVRVYRNWCYLLVFVIFMQWCFQAWYMLYSPWGMK